MITLGLSIDVTTWEGSSEGPGDPVPAAPANTAPPAISGTPQAGETLSVTAGTWSGSGVSFTYRWTRDGSPVPGATAATHALVATDAGAMIGCTVTASNIGGSASASAAAVGPVGGTAAGAPVNTAAPAIAGTPQEGETLSVTDGAWSGDPDGFTYRWTRDGSPLAGATAATYTLVAADADAMIGATVTASNAGGSASASAAAVGPVAAAVPPFVSDTYGQAVPASILVSAFATGDEAPSGANAGSWFNGEGEVSGGTINDVAGGAFGARFALVGATGGRLVPGDRYVATAEILALDPVISSDRIAFFAQGPLLSVSGGFTVRGVASFPFTASSDHSHCVYEKAAGLTASLDNLGLYNLTGPLAKPIDVYILAGQSNIVGNETFSQDTTGLSLAEAALDPRVIYVPAHTTTGDAGTSLTVAGEPTLLSNPLQHQTSNRGIGPGVSFASAIADVTPPERQIVVIAGGWAGASLIQPEGPWNRNGSGATGGLAYEGLLELVNDFLAGHPGATVRGMVWCQGEADRSSGPAATSNYVTAFRDELLSPYRTAWGDFPVVMLSMRENIGNFESIDNAHQQIAAGDPRIAYVRGTIDADGDGQQEDIPNDVVTFGQAIHYTREQQRLNGLACAGAMIPLLNASWS